MADTAPVRVAFTNIPSRLWAGGYNYQYNLFRALHQYCPGDIVPVLFAGTSDVSEEVVTLAGIPNVEVVQSRAFDNLSAGLITALTFGIDRRAVAEFEAKRIDIVFESARFFGWRMPLPAVAWFPDFQHRRLPHMFSRTARWRRDLGFRAQMASGRHILLSSNSALCDFRKFYPNRTNDTHVVRFATQPDSRLLKTDPFEVIAHYHLPDRYFFLPNQFWRHKNHQLVIDALAILKRHGLNVVVAASGGTKDPREPECFRDAMRRVEACGLDENFRHLGTIPLDHVYALLRTAVALINPSRFEGWSTTVEEAKSFGLPMILSDIDVHREQTNGSARYFGIDDPDALADHLLESLQREEPVAVRDLLPALDDRVKALAVDFVGLIRNAMKLSRRTSQSSHFRS